MSTDGMLQPWGSFDKYCEYIYINIMSLIEMIGLWTSVYVIIPPHARVMKLYEGLSKAPCRGISVLTHWSRVTHICVGDLTIIGLDNGLSIGRRQAIIRVNDGLLITWPLGTNFQENYSNYSRKCIWECRLENGGHFVSASMC